PFPDLADDTPVGPDDAAAVGLVGPNLFAADEQLGGSVDVGELPRTRNGDLGTRNSRGGFVPRSAFRVRCFPLRLQILPHPFPPPFAPEARLAVAAEPRRGVEEVGASHPHDAGPEPTRGIEGEVAG